LAGVGTDGGGDRSATDDETHIPDATTQRLEALAKRLAIEQKVSGIQSRMRPILAWVLGIGRYHWCRYRQ